MAEEAMWALGAKFFQFDEDGTYVPYQRTPSPSSDQPVSPTQYGSAVQSDPLDAPIQPPGHVHPSASGLSLVPAPTANQNPTSAPVASGSVGISNPSGQSNNVLGAPPTQLTVGLGLILNGKTYPKIENGKERWYTQRPGKANNYSRYSDLVSHDKAKGVTPMPRASKAELELARQQQTFG